MNNFDRYGDWPATDTATRAHLLRLDDLRAEAETERLARAWRRAHPETALRYRFARLLRTLADRLAPPVGDAGRTLRASPTSQPSPSH